MINYDTDKLFVAERISFVLGYDQEGKPMELQLAGTATRTILVKPNDFVLVANTHPVSGEHTLTEYFKDKFYAWNYIPRLPKDADVQEN